MQPQISISMFFRCFSSEFFPDGVIASSFPNVCTQTSFHFHCKGVHCGQEKDFNIQNQNQIPSRNVEKRFVQIIGRFQAMSFSDDVCANFFLVQNFN